MNIWNFFVKNQAIFALLKSTYHTCSYDHVKGLAIWKSWTIELKKDAKRIIKWGHAISKYVYIFHIRRNFQFLYQIAFTFYFKVYWQMIEFVNPSYFFIKLFSSRFFSLIEILNVKEVTFYFVATDFFLCIARASES